MASKEILVYGAGMSGMVAAFNLASEGFDVTVLEKEPSWGGSSDFNPSLHTTPLDVPATSEYIGVDLSSAFHDVTTLSIYLHDLEIPAPVFMAYHVERSSRPQSLDAVLYDKCVEVGVKFEFNTLLKKEDLAGLPEGTIIACGLNTATYDLLEVPYSKWYAWMARGEQEHANDAWMWADECINEYGYLSYCNGMYYNLLFAYGQEVTKDDLKKYEAYMDRVHGIHEDDWYYVHGAAPVVSPDNPSLFRDKFIMCGTMSGCIDPFMGFGISGGLVSGKVAAIAAVDREKGAEEFARFTRNYANVYTWKQEVWYPLRARVDLLEGIAEVLGPERTVKLFIEAIRKGRKNSAIPGYGLLSCN